MTLTQRNSPTYWSETPDPRFQSFSRLGYYQEMAFFRRTDIEQVRIEALTMRENYTGDGIIYENDGHTVRSIFGIHDSNHRIVDFLCTDKLIRAAMEILGSDVYIHQLHINYKQAYTGGGYFWHSDYTYWHWEDGMPAPRCLSFVIPLDTMIYENGPLYVHGGSHQYYGYDQFYRGEAGDADVEIKHDENDAGCATPDQLEMLASDDSQYGGPMHVILGSPGDVCIMDANLLHMSGPNWSPFDRACAFLCLNSVENDLGTPKSGRGPRPQYITNRTVKPL